MKHHKLYAVLLLLLLLNSQLAARESSSTLFVAGPEYSEAIAASREAIIEMMAESAVPGVCVAVAMEGALVWAEGFGVADIKDQTPVTLETNFGIGSISKVLTTALCARLTEAELLDLDEPVESYLPDFPHLGKGITVRLIAGHLSGLDDSFGASRRYTTENFKTTAEVLKLYYKKPLQHQPGETFHYGTSTFTVIAGVVEAVTGQSFPKSMDQHVFIPLGMNRTVPNDPNMDIPTRTSFYEQDETGRIVPAPPYNPSYKLAGAGYLSTVEDLVRFGLAMSRPGFLGQPTLDDVFSSQKTSDGRETGVGLGWDVRPDVMNRRIYFKSGGGPGISSVLLIYPEKELVAVILSNLTWAPVRSRPQAIILHSFLPPEDG